MASRRVYITIPSRDHELLRHLGVKTQECVAMISRRYVLQSLYRELQDDKELLDYDAELARRERMEVLLGGR